MIALRRHGRCQSLLLWTFAARSAVRRIGRIGRRRPTHAVRAARRFLRRVATRRMLMRANRSLAIGVATVCSVIGLFGLSASAQTSSGPAPINPPVAKCNMTPDTNPQNPKEPYPITDKLLTSG
ncbi:MAG TPA: hypothetical protein VEK75_07060, partial [Xanthobacteraceae bacterium]|nr:hypothetical protein [Xanthobacteraceae bacterium]